MSAPRTDDSRRVDWSKVKGDAPAALVEQIARFVKGIRGERKSPVSSAQILKWFAGTPRAFVEKAILEAVTVGKIRCAPRSLASSRQANGAYVYEAST